MAYQRPDKPQELRRHAMRVRHDTRLSTDLSPDERQFRIARLAASSLLQQDHDQQQGMNHAVLREAVCLDDDDFHFSHLGKAS
jgi:hypothetical protein